jgi:SAM-dependent methyltransferase
MVQKTDQSSFGFDSSSLGYSMRRYFIDAFFFRNVPLLPEGNRVLDVGGHKVRKRGYFDIGRYNLATVYANLTPDRLPDVLADAAHLPFKSASFHALICSELLEHVPDPRPVLQEAYRVLNRGGVLLLCVPFLNRIHGDPQDYGRYTDQYWSEVLPAIGFSDINIEKQGLFWCVLMDMLREFINFKFKTIQASASAKKIIVRLFGLTRRKALAWDARLALSQDSPLCGFTTGFGIKACSKK